MEEFKTKIDESERKQVVFQLVYGSAIVVLSVFSNNPIIKFAGAVIGLTIIAQILISYYARTRLLSIDSNQIKLIRKGPLKDITINWGDIDEIKNVKRGKWIYYKSGGLPSSMELRKSDFEEEDWTKISAYLAKHALQLRA